ncbi:hypothetical protein MBLNU457_g0566t1 [Dothideomycetes sp. NU457]
MNYNFDFDEADIFGGTQSVTDEQIDQLAQPLPAVFLPVHTQVQEHYTQVQGPHTPLSGHAMALPTPPPSSESSVTPPPEQSARTAAPKKSKAKPKKQPKQKAISTVPTQAKKPKNPALGRTPDHIARLIDEEILKLTPNEAKKVKGERLLEFLLNHRECELRLVTRDKDHSRIAHTRGRALQARADAQGRPYAELLEEFEKVSKSGRDKAAKAAETAAKKRSAADADFDDDEETTVKKARKTSPATTQAQSEEFEVETDRSASTMRDLGYSSASTGGLQRYVSPYDQETLRLPDTDPIYNLVPTSNLIWNNLLPFNARHDEFAACIDHSCAEGNGFSNLCSEEYLASIGLSGPTDNPHVNSINPCWTGNWAVDGASSSATSTASNQPSLPTHSHIGSQTRGWDTLDAAANELFPDLTRGTTDAQMYDTGFFANSSNNLAMMATNQVSQAQGVRSDLAMGVPSGGAISSQFMVGPIVGSNEFAAHRPADAGLENGVVAQAAAVAEQEMTHDEALDAERKRGFSYGAFETVSEIDAFDFDGALYGDAEDFFGGPPLFE